MTTVEIITIITLYLIIPFIGLLSFILLSQKIKRENIVNPPRFQLLLIFATYGVLLLIILIELVSLWSGLASLGVLYLIIGGPILMGIIAKRMHKNKLQSKYHLIVYRASLLYFIITPITLTLLIIF